MLNQTIPTATWQILHGDRADLAMLWLQALGTDAVIVPALSSLEHYHDYAYPEKFQGALPALYDDHRGTIIYSVPRVHPGIVRLVDRGAMNRVGELRGGDDAAGLAKYVAAIENPAQGASFLHWHGFDEAEIEAKAGPGQEVLVQETWDPAWHACENGRELPIRRENTMGFMLIDAAEGDRRIRMRFETPLENRVGRVILVLTTIVMAGLVLRR